MYGWPQLALTHCVLFVPEFSRRFLVSPSRFFFFHTQYSAGALHYQVLLVRVFLGYPFWLFPVPFRAALVESRESPETR